MQTKNLADIYKWGWVVLIILAGFLGVKTLDGLIDLKNGEPVYNSITVMGEGEAFIIPDLATFSFTVTADAATVSAAQEDVTEKVDTVIEAMKSMGIDEKDIKTTDYSVWPKYTYTQAPCTQFYCPPGEQKQDGYTANHSVTVKIRDTDQAGTALALAGDNGATNLSGISFTVDDPSAVTAEARALAIKDAKEKAEVLADELDVNLKKVISFYDSTDNGVMPYYAESVGYGMGGDKVSASVPSIPTGENRVKVNVNITYEIR